MSDITVSAPQLATFNRRWLEEVQQHLAPACSPHSSFWDRWAAVRYLADSFEEPYKLSGELLDELVGSLDWRTAGQLADDRATIGHHRVARRKPLPLPNPGRHQQPRSTPFAVGDTFLTSTPTPMDSSTAAGSCSTPGWPTSPPPSPVRRT